MGHLYNNNNVPFLYSAYHIQMASLCARGIITPALALMQPFSAKSIRRNKFLLGIDLTQVMLKPTPLKIQRKCLVFMTYTLHNSSVQI